MSEVEFIDIFAGNLESLLIERRMSRHDLVELSGVSSATISKYLARKQMPKLSALINLCLALDCDIDDLIPVYDRIV